MHINLTGLALCMGAFEQYWKSATFLEQLVIVPAVYCCVRGKSTRADLCKQYGKLDARIEKALNFPNDIGSSADQSAFHYFRRDKLKALGHFDMHIHHIFSSGRADGDSALANILDAMSSRQQQSARDYENIRALMSAFQDRYAPGNGMLQGAIKTWENRAKDMQVYIPENISPAARIVCEYARAANGFHQVLRTMLASDDAERRLAEMLECMKKRYAPRCIQIEGMDKAFINPEKEITLDIDRHAVPPSLLKWVLEPIGTRRSLPYQRFLREYLGSHSVQALQDIYEAFFCEDINLNPNPKIYDPTKPLLTQELALLQKKQKIHYVFETDWKSWCVSGPRRQDVFPRSFYTSAGNVKGCYDFKYLLQEALKRGFFIVDAYQYNREIWGRRRQFFIFDDPNYTEAFYLSPGV